MNKDNIEEILKNISAEEIPADVHKIAQETSNNFSSSLKQTRQPKQFILLGQIMKSRISKLAAAAAVIIIAALIINLQFISTSGVAWGALVEKIESIESVVYHLTGNATMQGIPQEQIPNSDTIAYYSSEYGTRAEQYMNGKLSFIMYLNPKENIFVTVIPEQKRFMRVIDKSPDELKQIAEKDDPRAMVRHMMSAEYKHLGRDKINGIDVEGIECTDQRVMGGMFEDATARLWVEIGTDFPVRI